MMNVDLGSVIGGLIGGVMDGRTDSTLVPVRVATTCAQDSAAAITDAIRELVGVFHDRNDCGHGAVRVVLFTATADLRANKPAVAARAAGWSTAHFLCLAEMPTDSDVARCIRGLLFVERGRGAAALKPVYLNGAHILRPDLAER
jgi:chorismate mutase